MWSSPLPPAEAKPEQCAQRWCDRIECRPVTGVRGCKNGMVTTDGLCCRQVCCVSPRLVVFAHSCKCKHPYAGSASCRHNRPYYIGACDHGPCTALYPALLRWRRHASRSRGSLLLASWPAICTRILHPCIDLTLGSGRLADAGVYEVEPRQGFPAGATQIEVA